MRERTRSGRRARARLRRADDDPLSLLVNFFDCSIVFALGLILMLGLAKAKAAAEGTPKDPVDAKAKVLPRYRPSSEIGTGEGTRLGTAYMLGNGEVVYVPDRPGK